MIEQDLTGVLRQAVQTAIESREPLKIAGGGSKNFFGGKARGRLLSLKQHQGIINYQPSELVLTARTGTLLSDLERVLAAQGQMLAFEPPHFGDSATLGGTVACGLSGPRRPFAGALRDFILGCKMINGKGEILSFGGEVMKNVAGYDVSRLMAGAMGTLGVLLEVSLKVLPRPAREATLRFEFDTARALDKMNALARQPLPVSGLSYDGSFLYIRLSGSERAVQAAKVKLGGDSTATAGFWRDLNEQNMPFFSQAQSLWRLSVPPSAKPMALPGTWFYDWGGAQRWLSSDERVENIFAAAQKSEGHALLFRGGNRAGTVFQPEQEALLQINRNLKRAFDPLGIFNPGRKYKEW